MRFTKIARISSTYFYVILFVNHTIWSVLLVLMFITEWWRLSPKIIIYSGSTFPSNFGGGGGVLNMYHIKYRRNHYIGTYITPVVLIHGLNSQPHLSVAWNWHRFIAIRDYNSWYPFRTIHTLIHYGLVFSQQLVTCSVSIHDLSQTDIK